MSEVLDPFGLPVPGTWLAAFMAGEGGPSGLHWRAWEHWQGPPTAAQHAALEASRRRWANRAWAAEHPDEEFPWLTGE